MKFYDIPSRILVQLNEGENPTILSEFVIRGREGRKSVNEDGITTHEASMVDVSCGLFLALAARIRDGSDFERGYIKIWLQNMIGEFDK